jgi:hypothetical protein
VEPNHWQSLFEMVLAQNQYEYLILFDIRAEFKFAQQKCEGFC